MNKHRLRWSIKWLGGHTRILAFSLLIACVPISPALAELAVSQLIVELRPAAQPKADIEIYNDSTERAFVAVEARELIDAGSIGERPFQSPDPEKLGLIASPARMILEPHQRRTLRIAAIVSEIERERVYRVSVKPVAGDVTSDQTGLKLLVGYDLLVLMRPKMISTDVVAVRDGNVLTLVNRGNASVELAEGRQCDRNGDNCQPLPNKRLYAGASWRQPFPSNATGQYRLRSADGWSTVNF